MSFPLIPEPLWQRYALISDGKALRDIFQAQYSIPFTARYNITPAQWAPVVRLNGGCREVVLMSWGLPPHRPSLIPQSGGESTPAAPELLGPFQHTRCLVPATGFYKWAAQGGGSAQPYLIHHRAQGLIAFAGVWERWMRGDRHLNAFTILETGANARVRPLAERMPVILGPEEWEEWEEWLDPETEPDRIDALQVPCPAACLDSYPVSHYLNGPDHDDPECVRKAPL